MTFRHLISSAFVFAALCATASAQGLVREWTIDYPYPTMPPISSDGELFARSLSTTAVVRYDGATGMVRDTITTPFTAYQDRVAFCGSSLYVLTGTRRDSLPMFRCGASDTVFERTPYTFRYFLSYNSTDSVYVKSVSLYSVPEHPFVLVKSMTSGTAPGGPVSFSTGQCESVDTTTFQATDKIDGELTSVSWSADPNAFIRVFQESEYDLGGFPNTYTAVAWCIETFRGAVAAKREYLRRNENGETAPNGFHRAVHAGALHNIIYDTVVYDLKMSRKKVLPDRSGRILGSLYSPSIVLKVNKDTSGDILSAYDY
ncbi:MAG: hypothetical protein EHM43_12000, partial [Ignavibacteriae bacterium]